MTAADDPTIDLLNWLGSIHEKMIHDFHFCVHNIMIVHMKRRELTA
jgi:hypothetical protein